MNSLCSVWSTEWVHPFESPWSVLGKYTLTNFSEKNEVLHLLGNVEIKSYKYKAYGNRHRDILTLSSFDSGLLQNILGFDLKEHNKKIIDMLVNNISCKCISITRLFHLKLHWCSECIKDGFHSVLHQSKFLNHCPFHLLELKSNCPVCKQEHVYSFTDLGMNGPYICQCGYSFIDYSNRWNSWVKPLNLECKTTIEWLTTNKQRIPLLIFNPAHLTYSDNPMKLLLEAINCNSGLVVNKIQAAGESTYSNTIDEVEFPDIDGPDDPHINHFLLKGHKCSNLYCHLYEVTRAAFLTIDRHLRSRLLRSHMTCISRFYNLPI